MRFGKSFFNVALFKKHVQRFWPIWILYTLAMIIAVPLYMMMNYSRQGFASAEERSVDFQNYLISFSTDSAYVISLIVGVVIACAIWSYLHNSRASYLIHSLPMNRTTLFVTNYVTGALFFLVPNVFVFALTYVVGLSLGIGSISVLLVWLYSLSMSSLFFYSFATLLAFVTGSILTLPVLYAIFNALAMVMYQILNWLFDEFLYGYTWNSMPRLEQWVEWLTPVVAMDKNVGYDFPEGNNVVAELYGLGVLGVYALVGLALVFMAYLLYRRRKLELAGEVIAEPFLKPVFRVGFAVCGGLMIATFFYAVFHSLFVGDFVSYMIFVLLWSAICYMAGDMILAKSVKPRRKSLKSCGILVVVLAVLGMFVQFDVFGYEDYVPELNEIENTTIIVNYNDHVLPLEFVPDSEKQEMTEQVIALHEMIISEEAFVKDIIKGNDPEIVQIQQKNYDDGWETWDWERVDIEYTLKNGRLVVRKYDIPITKELLEQEGASANALDAFINTPTAVLLRHFPQIDQIRQVKASVELLNILGTDQKRWVQGFDEAASNRLVEALLVDMKEGRIGIRHFLDTEENATIDYENNIYIVMSGEYNTEEMENVYKYRWDEHESVLETGIRLQKTATSTLNVLRDLGIDEESLTTKAAYHEFERVKYEMYDKQ